MTSDLNPGDRVRHLRAPKTTAIGVVLDCGVGDDPLDTAFVEWSIDGLGDVGTSTTLMRELEVVR